MKKVIYILIIAFFGVPTLSFAVGSESICSSSGYTVATINGIFTEEKGARDNMDQLKKKVGLVYKNKNITYQYLLNPTHLAGLGDIAKAAYQKYFEDEAVEDYDLVEMIRSAGEKVNTRKLLLVAHSQGNFYANSFYDTVTGTEGGVPIESIGVYAVAPPASRVAGGGKWITSSTDKVIAGLVGRVPNRAIMPPNTTIKIGPNDDQSGHAFGDTYLKYRGADIVSGIESSLDKLKVASNQDQVGPCIDPPKLTLGHRLQGVVLAAVDPLASASSNIIVGAVGGVYSGVKSTVSNIASAINSFNTNLAALPKSSMIAAASPILTNKIIAPNLEVKLPSAVVATTPPPPVAVASSVIADTTTLTLEIQSPKLEPENPVIIEADIVETTEVLTAPEIPEGGYIVTPLVYEAIPIPESYPIPSYSGGGSVDDGLLVVVSVDGITELSIEESTTTEVVAIVDIPAIVATTTEATTTLPILLPPPVLPLVPIDPTTLVATRPIVINEIAWGGTSSNSEDEWIELYNRSSEDVNLDGFTLYSKSDESPYIKLSGIIKSHGYFLIETKNTGEVDEATQSSIKNIPADLWVSFGARMSNGGENLVLSYSSTTIDEILFCANWCGVSSSRTTERVSPDGVGTDSSSWSANNSVTINGINSAGNSILGTPRARNSLNYLINRGASITSDITLTKDNSPYLVDNSTQTIAQGKTLNIEPGVVIKFRGSGKLLADGNIVANGTSGNPIVFTAFADDNYGGDTDGVIAVPTKGSWSGVELSSKSASSSFINNIFRYGGDSFARKSMLYISQSSPLISNSMFEYSRVYGLYLDRSNSVVTNNIFRGNIGDPFSAGLNISAGASNVSGNTFTQNNVGMSVAANNATITNNSFSDNTTAMSFSGPIGPVTGNSGGVNDVIKLSGSIATAPATTTLVANPMPYFLSGIVIVQPNSTLDIKEGVVIKNSINGMASQLNIFGKLNIDTSTTSGVLFTSNLSTLSRGSWMGILMASGSKSSIKGATISGASFGIRYINSPISLENVLFFTNTTGVDGGLAGPILKTTNVNFINNGIDKNPSSLW